MRKQWIVLLILALLPLNTAAEAVWVQSVPTQGTVRLGQRVIRAGEILERPQLEELVYTGAEVGYLTYARIEGGAVTAAASLRFRGRSNAAPIAEDSGAETYRNMEITGRLKVSDPEGDAVTYTLCRAPRRGTVTLNADGTFCYTPKKNKIGVDSFTYTAADDRGKVSREATVTVTIIRPSDDRRYTDTVGSDCRFAAEWMRSTGIFTGETADGRLCFFPQRTVTQGEWLDLLTKTLSLSPEVREPAALPEDLPSWLRPYAAAAQRAGLWDGKADAPIEEAEAACLLCSALGLSSAEALAVPLSEDAPLTRSTAAQLLYAAYRRTNRDIRILQ